jgi:hypothetical protein
VTGSTKTSEAFTEANTVVSRVRSLYSGQSGFGTGSITEVAVKARIFENKWLEEDQPINPWGGDVEIEGKGRTFTVSFAEVPQDACAQMVAMNTTGFGGAIRDVQVNGQSMGTQKVDPTDATAACDTDNDNEIIWEIR